MMNPYRILNLRAQARAVLWANGEYDTLTDAILPLAQYADATGITDRIGPENVVATILREFGLDAL